MYQRFIALFACMLCAYAAQAQFQELIPYRAGQLWGYSDTSGKIVITPQYQYANMFRVIGSGKTAITCAEVKKAGKRYYINMKGQKVTVKQGDIPIPTMTEAPSQMRHFRTFPEGRNYNEETGLYGFMTPDSITLFPFAYEKAYWVKYGYACFGSKNRMGVVSFKGDTIIPFAYQEEYDLIQPPDSNGMMKIVLNANKVPDTLKRSGFLSVSGRWVLKPAFEEQDIVHTGEEHPETIWLVNCSYNSTTGKTTLDTIKKHARQFSVYVSKSRRTGILRSDGKWEMPIGDYAFESCYNYPYIYVSQQGKRLGWMHVNGRKYWKN